ncbi:hypothetical protein FAES_1813 [Fibrella aestuarina BUZ 2]|uniref:Uncharacterized protein n=1 Tax=Fibrella aestuarina BUZ 2 TaxID=1166018 RepID=I0K6S0_9BACT|nr:hypothetical protein [Fibrella aestuarina]CCG99823.1 hypothetical protein FAES_1813 [Fibrella aestuarina BUZ 2]
MPKPPITFRHLKTSKLITGGRTIHRHWFAWSDRTSNALLTAHFAFLDADGNELTAARFSMPKVTVTGRDDEGKPIYNINNWVSIDDEGDNQPTQVRYYVVSGLLKKERCRNDSAGCQAGRFNDIRGMSHQITFDLLKGLRDRLQENIPTLDAPPTGFDTWADFYMHVMANIPDEARNLWWMTLAQSEPLPDDMQAFGLTCRYIQEQVDLERAVTQKQTITIGFDEPTEIDITELTRGFTMGIRYPRRLKE